MVVVGTMLLPGVSAFADPMRGGVPVSANQIVEALAASENRRFAEVQAYSATRRYVLKNARFNQDAEMLVHMQVTAEKGKVFQVLSEHGVEGLARRVFKKVLDGEAEASRTSAKQFNKVTPENYEFRLIGTEDRSGHRCHVMEIKAKSKSKYLMNGKIWVDATDYQIVRMEGRSAASLSFWVGKPYLVYDFQKVGGWWLGARNQSIADARIVGTTEMTVEVQGYELQPGREQKLALEKLPRPRAIGAVVE